MISSCFAYIGLLGLVGLFAFYKKKFSYWNNKNIPVTKPKFPMGDISQAGFFKNFGVVMKEIYDQFKEERFNGLWVFYRPYLMIRDPELIKAILVKDFNNFRDRGLYYNGKSDPLSANLFFMGGDKWRFLRAKLTANFSSGKMKKIFETMAARSLELQESLRFSAENKKIIDPKYYTVRYTHDVASTCLLGFQTDCLKNPQCILPEIGQKIFEASWSNLIRLAMSMFVPDLGTLVGVRVVPKEVTKYFFHTVKDVLLFRDSQPNKDNFNDFMQTLVRLKNQGYMPHVEVKDLNGNLEPAKFEKNNFSSEDAMAQAFIFWMGAFESSSSTMQYALYEMSLNSDIQEKARSEVKRVLAEFNGQLTYESLSHLEYLGRLIDETLRKYPPVPVLTRICIKKYKIPDSDVIIEEGTPVSIPVLGLHKDPKYFPDPEKFDPDRFTEKEKQKRHNYTFLPFGGGLHQCIGQRYGLMQIKVGLARLLAKYKFDITPETPKKLRMCRKHILYSLDRGIPLKISEILD